MKLSQTGMGNTKLNNIDEMYPGQSILLQTGQLVQYGAGINETDWNGRTVIDIVPNNEKTVETIMSFSPILDGKNLKRFATDFPNELIKHPELNKYIDKLILYGCENILPKELIDIFLF
jgi:hypothetical protein